MRPVSTAEQKPGGFCSVLYAWGISMEKEKGKNSIGRILDSLPGEMVLVTAEGTVLAQKCAETPNDFLKWPAVALFSGTPKACRLHWRVPGGQDPALTVGPLELLLAELVVAGPGYWFRRLLTEPAGSLNYLTLPSPVLDSVPCRLGALKMAVSVTAEAQEALAALLPDLKTYLTTPGFIILKMPSNPDLAQDCCESVMALLAEELLMDPLMIYGEIVSDLGMLQLHASALENISDVLYGKGIRGMQTLIAHLPALVVGGFTENPLPLVVDLGRLIEPVLKDPDLSQTATAFIQTNLSISETAQNLFLHRNTLVYRLSKIEKLTGLDLKRLDQAMAFVLLKAARAAAIESDPL